MEQEGEIKKGKRKYVHHAVMDRVKEKAVEVVFEGKTKTRAARELGICRQTLIKEMKKDEIREHLLRIANLNAVQIVPTAMKNVKKYVEKLNGDRELCDKEMELGWKATEKSLEMGGLLGRGGETYHLTQIYQENKVLVSPMIQSLLEEHGKQFTFTDVELKQIENKKDN